MTRSLSPLADMTRSLSPLADGRSLGLAWTLAPRWLSPVGAAPRWLSSFPAGLGCTLPLRLLAAWVGLGLG